MEIGGQFIKCLDVSFHSCSDEYNQSICLLYLNIFLYKDLSASLYRVSQSEPAKLITAKICISGRKFRF